MSDDKPICGTCRFFDEEAMTGTPAKRGICRVHPPSPNSAKPWPVVARTDWCGSHATVPVPESPELVIPE